MILDVATYHYVSDQLLLILPVCQHAVLDLGLSGACFSCKTIIQPISITLGSCEQVIWTGDVC